MIAPKIKAFGFPFTNQRNCITEKDWKMDKTQYLLIYLELKVKCRRIKYIEC